ncbi:hypothetical protein CRG98_048804, partial [Punica granatum]
MLGCKGMHIRGARRTGARGWNAREARGRAAGRAGALGARLCSRARCCAHVCAAGRASVRLR